MIKKIALLLVPPAFMIAGVFAAPHASAEPSYATVQSFSGSICNAEKLNFTGDPASDLNVSIRIVSGILKVSPSTTVEDGVAILFNATKIYCPENYPSLVAAAVYAHNHPTPGDDEPQRPQMHYGI